MISVIFCLFVEREAETPNRKNDFSRRRVKINKNVDDKVYGTRYDAHKLTREEGGNCVAAFYEKHFYGH